MVFHFPGATFCPASRRAERGTPARPGGGRALLALAADAPPLARLPDVPPIAAPPPVSQSPRTCLWGASGRAAPLPPRCPRRRPPLAAARTPTAPDVDTPGLHSLCLPMCAEIRTVVRCDEVIVSFAVVRPSAPRAAASAARSVRVRSLVRPLRGTVNARFDGWPPWQHVQGSLRDCSIDQTCGMRDSFLRCVCVCGALLLSNGGVDLQFTVKFGEKTFSIDDVRGIVSINLGFYAQRWTWLTITFVTFLLHTI